LARKGTREKRDSKTAGIRARRVRGKSVSLVSLLRVSCPYARQSAVRAGESEERTYEEIGEKNTERTKREKLETAKPRRSEPNALITTSETRRKRRGRYSRKGYKSHETEK
jgi:hypothetical protein